MGAEQRASEFTNGGFTYRALFPAGALLTGSVVSRAANWSTIAAEYGQAPLSRGDVFTMGYVHPHLDDVRYAPLCYAIQPAAAKSVSKAAGLLRSSVVTGFVTGSGANISLHAIFWSAGSIAFNASGRVAVSASRPCAVVLKVMPGAACAWRVAVADPSRQLHLSRSTLSPLVIQIQRSGRAPARWAPALPQGAQAGATASAVVNCSCF